MKKVLSVVSLVALIIMIGFVGVSILTKEPVHALSFSKDFNTLYDNKGVEIHAEEISITDHGFYALIKIKNLGEEPIHIKKSVIGFYNEEREILDTEIQELMYQGSSIIMYPSDKYDPAFFKIRTNTKGSEGIYIKLHDEKVYVSFKELQYEK